MAERSPWITDASGALHAPATTRNREPIREVLKRHLPRSGLVLEIASGSGEHAAYFASAFPGLIWQPSDPDAAALASIAAHRAASGLANLAAPVQLDVTETEWSVVAAAAIVAINMIHIAPWRATEGLMAGACRLLPRGGLLYTYGPYRHEGAHTAPSNAAFDASLKARNAEWGIRDWSEVAGAAQSQGLALIERAEMPANNMSLVFRRERP